MVVEQWRLEIYERTIRSILVTVQEYLPPDSSVTKHAFIERVIEAVDTPEICRALGIK